MDDDRAADLYELTQELTDKAGYPAYEISNHARRRRASVGAQPHLLGDPATGSA